ncbi:MAG: SDR family NAD(P)-dependent oxidoreductase [Bacteroidales bacterium]|nr:SDR family NAD(P)-dependent oxidoreductase [Bacteroidales bacterium]
MKTVLITGATSGIGLATAELLSKDSYKLILCGRRKNRLENIKVKLSMKCPIHTLCFDISKRNEVEKAISSLTDEWSEIDILINNAGNAHGMDPIDKGNIDDWDAMIDINVKGLLYISRAVVPGMVTRKNGHIINIGSIAGREVYPSGNVYCASKSAVHAISQGMRIDLNEYNIKVTQLDPGMVDTEFSIIRFKGNKKRADNVYREFEPLHAQDIAETILFVITRPAHVNIADILIMPASQASATMVKKDI